MLLKLVDCCDDDGKRIFPAIATVARAAMCEPRTVQRVLRQFCDVGLLRKVREGGAGPGSTACYELNIERLTLLATRGWDALAPFARAGEIARGEGERKHETGAPCPAGLAGGGGHGDEHHAPDASTQRDAPPSLCANMGDIKSPLGAGRVTSGTDKGDMMCHPTPQEYTPQDEREGAGARDGFGEGQRAEGGHQAASPLGDPDLTALTMLWPTGAIEDLGEISRAWAALPFADRADALRRAPSAINLAKASRRQHLGKLATWLTNRNFALLPDPEPEQAGPQGAGTAAAERAVIVSCWSRDWWAGLFAKAIRGEAIAFTISQAVARGGDWSFKAGDLAQVRPERLRQFRADNAAIEPWRTWFAARGARLPDWRDAPERIWLWLPCEHPDGLAAWMNERGDKGEAA